MRLETTIDFQPMNPLRGRDRDRSWMLSRNVGAGLSAKTLSLLPNGIVVMDEPVGGAPLRLLSDCMLRFVLWSNFQ